MCVYVCLCVGMCTWVQMPLEARRGDLISRGWSCELSDMGTGNQTEVLGMRLLSSSPMTLVFGWGG